MKILIKADTYDEFDDGGINCLLVELNDDYKKQLFARRELLQMVRSKDSDIYALPFWGIPGRFHNIDLAEILESFGDIDAEYLVMEDTFEIEGDVDNEDEDDPIRTELEMVYITEDGFYFTAGIEHSSINVESRKIPYEVLLEGK
jgi:hypothetical protein